MHDDLWGRPRAMVYNYSVHDIVCPYPRRWTNQLPYDFDHKGVGQIYSRKRAPMGSEPYMLAEQGVGTFSSVSAFNPERVPTFAFIRVGTIIPLQVGTPTEVER